MTTDASHTAARAALLDRIQRSWDTLRATVDSLDERQISGAGPEGWSVNDHLAHIAHWEQATLDTIEGRDQRGALGIAEGEEPTEDMVNARLQEGDARLSTSEVHALLASVHARLVARIESLDTETLERWRGKIDGNTHEHFDEHLGWIRGLVVQNGASA
jgi:hypothetical protein